MIRAGRYGWRVSTSTPGTAAAKLVGGDPKRVAILFSVIVGSSLTVIPGGPLSGAGGLLVNSNAGTLQLLFGEVGDLCQAEWWGFTQAAGQAVTVVEVWELPGAED